jgi:hypothetical protein
MTPEEEAYYNAKHQALLAICRRLPTDYTDYGGTVERWADDEVAYPDCSCGCRWAEWLLKPLGFDWCVCTNPASPRAGLLTFEHMAGVDCFEDDPAAAENDDDPIVLDQFPEFPKGDG